MKSIVSFLSAAVLATSTFAAHASPVNPLNDGYLISVNGQTLTTNNLVADLNVGAPASSFVFADGLTQYIFVEANVTNAASAISVTELCATIDFTACHASTISVSDANVGAISLAAEVNASLTAGASVNAGTIDLATVADLGADSATVAFASAPTGASASPVPEPSTLGLMATGLMGAAGALRRKFAA